MVRQFRHLQVTSIFFFRGRRLENAQHDITLEGCMGARGLLYRRILLWPQGTRPVHNAQLFRVLLNMYRLAAKVVEARARQNDHAVECRVRSVQGSPEVPAGGRIRRLTLSGRGLSNAVKRNTRRSGNLGVSDIRVPCMSARFG